MAQPIAPSNWSPEDALDGPNTATAVSEAPDKQALEAIERNKAIQAARGDDAVMHAPVQLVEVAQKGANLVSDNPIITMAHNFAAAEQKVTAKEKHLSMLGESLKIAQSELSDAVIERDQLKAALQRAIQ
ncbi:MAG: hypothetical protein ACREQ5_11800 [Candidatus Dormibacteria bacterium]